MTVSRRLLSNLNFLINGNPRNYLLTTDNEQQRFRDLSSTLIYLPFRNIRLKFDGIYRLQDGSGINLNLSSFRGEISTWYCRVLLTLGGETYQRVFPVKCLISEALN